jgi:ribose/xylose/arabinose/galactoside ABC-type transport system permease subunit
MAILMSLLVALVVGLTNGLLVGVVRLKGFVVTFAMSFLLNGLILIWGTMSMPKVPAALSALARSPLILLLWILLAIACAVLMIFTSLGRRPRAGEPEQVPPGLRGLLYKGLPFVFSSFMAWISGILLLSWLGYATIGAGSGFAETALLATLMGGTAYYAGTGFVLSGTIALIPIVLFQQMLSLPAGEERAILGALLLTMLPITHYYHVGVDWLYRRQMEKAKDASIGDGSQLR